MLSSACTNGQERGIVEEHGLAGRAESARQTVSSLVRNERKGNSGPTLELIAKVSDEFGLGGRSYGTAWRDQGRATAAFNGTHHLVVWIDERYQDQAAHGNKAPPLRSLFATRVGTDGTIVDPGGILIAEEAPHDDWHVVDVASDGTNWLVVWTGSEAGGAIKLNLVDASGRLFNQRPVSFGEALGAVSVAAAWDGTDYVVAWSNITNGVRLARVSASGTVHNQFNVANTVAEQSSPDLACAGGTCLVAWSDYRHGPDNPRIYAGRINGVATLDHSAPIVTNTRASSSQSRARVASDGTGFVVVWEDLVRTPSGSVQLTSVQATRIDAVGTALDPGGILITEQAFDPAIAFGSNQYVVAFERLTAANAPLMLSALRLSRSAQKLDVNPVDLRPQTQVGNVTSHPALSSGGAGYLLTNTVQGSLKDPPFEPTTYPPFIWQTDIAALRLGPSLEKLGDPQAVVSGWASPQLHPRVAFNGANYFATWLDGRVENARLALFGSRVSTTGTLLDPCGIQLSPAGIAPAVSPLEQWHGVASDGSSYLAVWTEQMGVVGGGISSTAGIYAAIVAANGVVTKPRFAIKNTGLQSEPRVVFGAGQYFVLWTEAGELRGSRVTRDGTVLDPNGVFLTLTIAGNPGSLASDGTNYLVLSSEVVIVAPNASIVSRKPVSPLLQGSAASDGTGYLVVFNEPYYRDPNDTLDHRLIGHRWDGAANPIAGAPITVADRSAVGVPAVTWATSRYLVTWQSTVPDALKAQVQTAEVTTGGAVTNIGNMLSSGTDYESTPSVAAGADGDFLLAYRRFVFEQPDPGLRVRARLVRSPDAEIATGSGGASCLGTGGTGGFGGVPPDGGGTGGIAEDAAVDSGHDIGVDDGGNTDATGDTGVVGDSGVVGGTGGSSVSTGGTGGTTGSAPIGGTHQGRDGGRAAAGGSSAAGDDGGCGCRTTSGNPASLWVLVAACLVASRLRRRTSRAGRASGRLTGC
jgi:hypothetical protein